MSMFTLAIFCLTTSNLPWFMDLIFQVSNQYCSLQHWALLSPPDASITERHFCFGPATSFFLELLVIALCHSPAAYWTPSDVGAHLPMSFFFAFSYCLWGSCRKNTGVGFHSLLQWIMFCQNSSLWLICLGWPCTAWFIASLSYTSPFTTAGLWSMKRSQRTNCQHPLDHGENKRIQKKKKKNLCLLHCPLKPLTMWITTNCGKFSKRWEYQTTLTAS